MLPVKDIVYDTEVKSTELLEGRLGKVEPLTVGAGVTVVDNLDSHLVALVREGNLVTALERRVLADSSDEVIVVGGRAAASGLSHHVARVVSHTAVVARALELGGGSEGNAKEREERGSEEGSTHCG